jgi:prophage regulatory protein
MVVQNVSQDACTARLIPLHEVTKLTGRGRSNIYTGINAGTFPSPIKDGASSRWLLSEIEQWIRERVAERDRSAAA